LHSGLEQIAEKVEAEGGDAECLAKVTPKGTGLSVILPILSGLADGLPIVCPLIECSPADAVVELALPTFQLRFLFVDQNGGWREDEL
jgi:hypothetical protein